MVYPSAAIKFAWIAARACLIVGALTLAVPSAHSFSLQLNGGGVLPLSAYVQNSIRIEEFTADGAEDSILQSRLVDQQNAFGFGGALVGLFGRFELRYVFQRLGWKDELTRCVGIDGVQPQVLPSGDIDDAAVLYDCNASAQSQRALGTDELSPLDVHVLSFGYRQVFDASDVFSPYVSFGGGFGLATYSKVPTADTNLIGLYMTGAIGASIPVSDLFAVQVEARYNLLLTVPPDTVQRRANRAAANDRSSISTLLDEFQFVTFGLGLEFHFN